MCVLFFSHFYSKALILKRVSLCNVRCRVFKVKTEIFTPYLYYEFLRLLTHFAVCARVAINVPSAIYLKFSWFVISLSRGTKDHFHMKLESDFDSIWAAFAPFAPFDYTDYTDHKIIRIIRIA
jgi:hypothetical protein